MTQWQWNNVRKTHNSGKVLYRSPAASIGICSWLSVVFAMALVIVFGDTLSVAPGIEVELSGYSAATGEVKDCNLVALLLHGGGETLVFFDDARYTLNDPKSEAHFAGQLAERSQIADSKTMLVISDKDIAVGDIMHFAGIVCSAGITKLNFAQKHRNTETEDD